VIRSGRAIAAISAPTTSSQWVSSRASAKPRFSAGRLQLSLYQRGRPFETAAASLVGDLAVLRRRGHVCLLLNGAGLAFPLSGAIYAVTDC
jgi:hypothetical protein